LVVFGVMGLRAADHNLALADFDATGPEGMPYRFPNDGPEHPRRGEHNAQANDTEEKEHKVNGRHDLLENKAQKQLERPLSTVYHARRCKQQRKL